MRYKRGQRLYYAGEEKPQDSILLIIAASLYSLFLIALLCIGSFTFARGVSLAQLLTVGLVALVFPVWAVAYAFRNYGWWSIIALFVYAVVIFFLMFLSFPQSMASFIGHDLFTGRVPDDIQSILELIGTALVVGIIMAVVIGRSGKVPGCLIAFGLIPLCLLYAGIDTAVKGDFWVAVPSLLLGILTLIAYATLGTALRPSRNDGS